MKTRPALYLFLAIALVTYNVNIYAQNPENWTSQQLMQPSSLAQLLKTNKNLPVIFCVGPGATIPNSVNVGMTRDKQNLDLFKSKLKPLPLNTSIVIYCGCCPFEHCPNVRPAIDVLKQMNFTNYKLLNLPHNLKTDWIDKGFPTKD